MAFPECLCGPPCSEEAEQDVDPALQGCHTGGPGISTYRTGSAEDAVSGDHGPETAPWGCPELWVK